MFKWHILKTQPISSERSITRFVISEHMDEAEKLYKKMSKTLNKLAYNYHISTGINKEDLFSEALMGLSKAIQNYRLKGADTVPFKVFAIKVVKDYLNKYVSKQSFAIRIPTHLLSAKKVYYILNEELNSENPREKRIIFLKEKLNKIAKRSGLDIKDLVDRINLLPTVIEDINEEIIEIHTTEPLSEGTKKLLSSLSIIERDISCRIMNGQTYREIGLAYNKSHTWVKNQLNNIKLRFQKGENIV